MSTSNLAYSSFERSILVAARLVLSNLRNVDFDWADLGYAVLDGADVTGASLDGTHLEAVSLDEVTGLPQEQLDTASAGRDAKLPPGLKVPDHWRHRSSFIPKNQW